MFIDFFSLLRQAQIPVSIKEFIALHDALAANAIPPEVDSFYYLARTCLIKDERHFDNYDKAFEQYFQGKEAKWDTWPDKAVDDDWVKHALERIFSKEEMNQIEAMQDWSDLLDTFKKRLEEQQKRHQGGNRWIGTGGTSPFGNSGFNPKGIKVGEGGAPQRKAVKVWQKRQYQPLSGETTLSTRNIQTALRRLRLLTREGRPDEVDVDGTIRETSRKGAMFDVLMRPTRKNHIKVLLFFDIGGSMSPYVKRCEGLFSSARSSFKRLKTFYFHNCIYEHVWQDAQRWSGRMKTWDIIRQHSADHRVIIIGDASMSPYEILQAGGSVDHFNEEPGLIWLRRLGDHFQHLAWINPEPEKDWEVVESIRLIQKCFPQRMFPLTTDGLSTCMQMLRKKQAPLTPLVAF